MKPFCIIEAASVLGLQRTGVERLPQAMQDAGLYTRLKVGKRVTAIAQGTYNGVRDPSTEILNCYELRAVGNDIAGHARLAVRRLTMQTDGFWIHLDVDVLKDEDMPAVDYRMPGGLSFDQLVSVLQEAKVSGKAMGLTLAIFNPMLDEDGSLARKLVDCLIAGLTP